MEKAIAFVGRADYLELRISNLANFERIRYEIISKLEERNQFFEGSKCIRIIGKLTKAQREELTRLFVDTYKVKKVEFIQDSLQQDILSEDINTEDFSGAFKNLRRQVREIDQVEKEEIEPLNLKDSVSQVKEAQCLVVSETVRNGQRVAYNGDILVIGDVNIGAELVATGNIAVMGLLRGKAHAGSAGDESACVAASRLSPQQLRIGAQLAIAPEKEEEISYYAEVAIVAHDNIVIMPINARKNSLFQQIKKRQF